MLTKLWSATTLVVATLIALPAVAMATHDSRHGDVCTDPSGVEADFTCGEVVVILAADADATMEEVIERSAPDAEIIESVADVREREGLPPLDVADRTYRIAVPVDSEIDHRGRFAEDSSVEDASLASVGATIPDTALPAGGVSLTLIGVACLLLALTMGRHRVVRGR